MHRRSSEDNTIDTARRCKAYCVRTVLHGLHIQGGFWQQRMKKDELCRCFSSVFLILICQWLGSRENLQEPSANHGFPHEIWKVPVHFPYSTSPMNVEVSISGLCVFAFRAQLVLCSRKSFFKVRQPLFACSGTGVWMICRFMGQPEKMDDNGWLIHYR